MSENRPNYELSPSDEGKKAKWNFSFGAIRRPKNKSGKEKNSKNKKKLADNKLFLMGMSVLAAFCMWVGISFSDTTTEISKRIENVPIMYENLPEGISDLGLEVIESSIKVKSVDVTIYGKQYIVNQIDASDLRATVKYRDVTGAGFYTGDVQVTNASGYWNFRINSVSVSTVTVQLDRMVTQDFTLEYETNEYKAANGYMLRVPRLSETVVKVTGASEDIAKIEHIVAKTTVPDVISATATYSAQIIMRDEEGHDLTGLNVEITDQDGHEIQSTELSIVALAVRTVPIRVAYLNAPHNIAERVSLSVNSIELAIPTDMVDSVHEIVVGTIDFSQVNPDTDRFAYSIGSALPAGCVNQSNAVVATALINVRDLIMREFDVTDLRIKNTTGVNAEMLSKSVHITVVGPSAQLGSITAKDISITADVSDYKNSSGKMELDAVANIANGSECWIYGEPTVLVQINEVKS